MDEEAAAIAFNSDTSHLNAKKVPIQPDLVHESDDWTNNFVKIKTETLDPEENQIYGAVKDENFGIPVPSTYSNGANQISEETALIKGTEVAFTQGLLSEDELIVFRNVLERVLNLARDNDSTNSPLIKELPPMLPCIPMVENNTTAFNEPANQYAIHDDTLQYEKYYKMLKEQENVRRNVETLGDDEILEMISRVQKRCHRIRSRSPGYFRSPSGRHRSRRYTSRSRSSHRYSRSRSPRPSRHDRHRVKSHRRRWPSSASSSTASDSSDHRRSHKKSSRNRSKQTHRKHMRANKHRSHLRKRRGGKHRKNPDKNNFNTDQNAQQKVPPTIKVYQIPRKINKVNDIHHLRTENPILRNATLSITKKIPDRSDETAMNLIVEIDKQSFHKVMKNNILTMYGKQCTAREYISVLRCLNCYGYHHRCDGCRTAAVCGKCAGKHRTEKCTSNIRRCVNCISANMELGAKLSTDHCAWWKECTVYQDLVEAKKRNIDY